MAMLSNLVLSTQRFVLIIDELCQEKLAHIIIAKLLREQGQDATTIKTLTSTAALRDEAAFDAFANECIDSEEEHKWNVLLPPLSDLCCYQRPSVLFHFIQELKECQAVRRTFLWASSQNLPETEGRFLIACFEYMSDLVLHLQTPTHLAIITRKLGGGVTNKSYTYRRTKNEFLVESATKSPEKQQAPETSKSQLEPAAETFKIELEEDELVARNALTLPYEKTSETTEADIVYTPDAEDDFDDEDPDEDLCI